MRQSHSKQLGFTLSHISRIWNQHLMRHLREEGYYNLKPSFCSVFFPLFENDGQSTSELARATDMTKQTMNIYIHELRQKGYVKLVQDSQDKRIRRVHLTAKGFVLEKVFFQAHASIAKNLCKDLSFVEISKLIDLLDKCLERSNLPK